MKRQLVIMYTFIAASLLATVLVLLNCAERDFVYDNPCDKDGTNYRGCDDEGYIGKGNDISNYRTVVIGTQTWMAENLDYRVGGSVCHDNSVYNCAKYGRLYDWGTAMGLGGSYYGTVWGGSDVNHRGICPVGWHLPSRAEWDTLENFVGGSSTAGRKLKSTSFNGTDEYGFSALPGGYGSSDGYFINAGSNGYWWSATEGNAINA